LVCVGFAVADGARGGKRGRMMDRVEVLEERVAHLLRSVDDLSDIVAAHATEVARLTRLVGLLASREAEREATGADATDDQRPPHW
jgi:SlyX protein